MTDDPKPEPPEVPSGSFPMTRWTRVQALRSDDPGAAQRALGELCETYWLPIYSYFRRQGRTSEDAKDLCQGFFERLITNEGFSRAEQGAGKLRSYLLTSARNHLIGTVRKERREKRGGGAYVFSLDADEAEGFHQREMAEDLAPDKLFERQWAVVTLERVRGELAKEYAARGRGEVFDLLSPYLAGGDGEPPYAEVATRAGINETAVRASVSRMRKRYRVLLREHIADTLDEGEDVDGEIRYLAAALG